jgi:hypothetical protein
MPLDGVKVPVELVVNVTVPVGVTGLAASSVTVTLQVVGLVCRTKAGEQLTLVAVGSSTVRGAVVA